MTPDELIAVWLEAGESRWFTKDAVFDGMLSVRFGVSLREARLGTFDHWTATARGSLGLVLLLDQVSRNIHRNSALAFAGDARALAVAATSSRALAVFHTAMRCWAGRRARRRWLSSSQVASAAKRRVSQSAKALSLAFTPVEFFSLRC